MMPNMVVAQVGSIRGRVVDDEGLPLGGVNVVLRAEDGRLIGTATDEGFYVLSRVLPGVYELSVSFVGFVTITDTISFSFGEAKTKNFTLLEDESVIETVVIESERAANAERPAGLSIVTPRTLNNIPTPGLSRDLAGALTRSGGVVTLGDRGGQLYIRGGAPMQNLFLIDGMRILQPMHILNQFSVFPADILSYADIYAGGFGAYYGGRVAAVVDVNTRNGNKKRFEGSASVSPFIGAVKAEIPIVDDRASLILS
ncbi:MAG: TonB-dependent receptor plug domain-containing protein, partial [Rhodothermales bacterium]|nr:TonB-dependent receptor plug domain-containing protein [Rhodothermales bacterium]